MKDDQDEERSAFDITVTYSEAGEVDNFSGNQCSPPGKISGNLNVL